MKASTFKSIQGQILENEVLKNYVSLRIGGPADIFIKPRDERDIQNVMQICHAKNLPLLTLGAGTNLLVRDGGFRGVVLFLGPGLEGDLEILKESPEQVTVRVPAHWAKARLLDVALKNSWRGLEFSAGIPGTLGGAVFMNAGTKWGSYGDIIEQVKLFSASRGFVAKTREEMKFKYRGHGEGLLDASTIVVSVDLLLSKSLKNSSDAQKSLALVDEILAFRGAKQPLELPNCGSVFKNPADSERGAGRLIEASGLKGLRVGKAMVSEKHANFILNLGGARSGDVESLISSIQSKVELDSRVRLEPEVIVLGQD